MFRRDPVPAQSTALAPNVLKHVHGAVYICGDTMRPGCQPKADLAKGDMGDHSAQAYMGALSSNCKRQSDREKTTGATHKCVASHVGLSQQCSRRRLDVCQDVWQAMVNKPGFHSCASCMTGRMPSRD